MKKRYFLIHSDVVRNLNFRQLLYILVKLCAVCPVCVLSYGGLKGTSPIRTYFVQHEKEIKTFIFKNKTEIKDCGLKWSVEISVLEKLAP